MNCKKDLILDNLNEIKQMLSETVPLIRIAKLLGVKYDTLKHYLDSLNVEYKTNQSKKGFKVIPKKETLDRYLNNEVYCSAPILRSKLITSGLKEAKCECCNNTEWMGKPIPLELHHINGDHYDNRLENLQILCSNCHSLKHDVGKNGYKTVDSVVKEVAFKEKRKYTKKEDKVDYFCKVCGEKITDRSVSGLCRKCQNKLQRKIEWPSKEKLEILHKELPNTKIAKKYGVSDKTVGKWLRYYNIN